MKIRKMWDILIESKRLQLLTFFMIVMGLSSCSKQVQEIKYMQASRMHDEGKFDKAIEIYKQLIESDRENSQVQYDLGVAYVEIGDYKKALAQRDILKDIGRDDLAQTLDSVISQGNKRNIKKKTSQDESSNDSDR